MKIAVISSQVFAVPLGGYGGLEVIAYECAKGLAAKGHSVSLVAPTGSVCPGVEIINTGPAGRVSERGAYSQYWQRLPEFDAVIDHSWNKYAYILKGEGKLKAPVLGVLHAPTNTMLGSLPPNVAKPCFVCISEDQKNHCEALFSPAKGRVVRNGIDTDFYSPIKGIERTNRYLFLARFSKIKGPLLALQACRVANTGLDLVGDCQITQEPDYLKECQAMCDGKQMRMIGNASRGECVWHFSRAHALLHPNQLFREPAGLAPLEAMACMSPCVAWRYGAMQETIRHGETGFLVSSLEEMTELVKTDAVSTIDRKRCREWVCDNYGIQQMVNNYESLCFEAISGGW